MNGRLEVKFGDWIQRGFNLYMENFGLLVLASLIAVVLSAVTLGILAGPMYAGLIVIALALLDRREPAPQVGDLFRGFDYFLQSFLFWLVWCVVLVAVWFVSNLLPCVGLLVWVVCSAVLEALLLFAMFFIVNRGMDFWSASTKSMETARESFLPLLAFAVVVGFLGSLGSVLCGIGVALTLPFAVAATAVAYRDRFPAGPSETAAPAPPAEPARETPPVERTDAAPETKTPPEADALPEGDDPNRRTE